MEPTFKIQAADNLSVEANLVIEISLWGISYIVVDSKNVCQTLLCYNFPADANYEKAAKIIKQSVATQPILQEVFAKVSIIYSYPTAMIVPHAMMGNLDKKVIMELVYGDINDAYLHTEFVYKQNIHILYTVPKQIDSVISYLFSADNITHLYSLLPDLMAFNQNHLYCIFGNNCFTVQLIKNGKLQVIQSFSYNVPEDVAYYLLQLCESFTVPPEQVILHINGMLDTNSALYGELSKYFLQLQLQTLPKGITYPDKINRFPAHYFSHLFSMALCV